MTPHLEITVDMAELADALGVTTRFLDKRIYDHGLGVIANEATRIAFSEAFDVGLKTLAPPAVELRHLVAAAKELLDLGD